MRLILFIVCAASLWGCRSNHTGSKQSDQASADTFVPQFNIPGNHVLVYKTRKPYNHLVPVQLSADKSEIVAYPSPADLGSDSNTYKPVQLHNQYLLDKKGISTESAFLSLSYGDYIKLKEAPLLADMQAVIADKEPLTELYDCGSITAFTDVEAQLNTMIDGGRLKTSCKVIR